MCTRMVYTGYVPPRKEQKMKYHQSISEVKSAKELDALGEDGQLWLQKKYDRWELVAIYDHHNGAKDLQRYIAQAMTLQNRLAKQNG